MKAIAITPGTKEVELVDREEPFIHATDEIRIKVLQVGICGTDREEVSGGRADAPDGKNKLVIGHEMFGQVVEVGKAVTKAARGDYGLFTVRRGCGKCSACKNGRSDMCYTGKYTERGIKGADGYETEFVVDKEAYFVPVPESIKNIGVLTEPMSVAAKAIDEAMMIQAVRLGDFDDASHWLKGKKALVAGLGPVGLLAALALRVRGADVLGMDIVDENSARPHVLKAIGGRYVNGRKVNVEEIGKTIEYADFVFEAAGIAKLQFELIDTMAKNAIYMATGIPAEGRPLTMPGAELMQRLVLNNQIIVGSVNASRKHYEQAVNYLVKAKQQWPEAVDKIITHRYPFGKYDDALHNHGEDEIKVVIDWSRDDGAK